ncbi:MULTISPECIES: MlaE family ABC transporter permease [Paracoccus]|uniref:MlaE family ABC transporter permease n=1 Tax=Paracoccus TaxID=265 RepID=UPI0007810FC1|nr:MULTISPECIES: ABC transporter permease [Paracoccus]MCV2446727.1 ABC transporter permease [Paracoccus sp. DMF]MDQ7776367.1 ABC transporter permease [Paracoccus aminovorans]
MASLPADPQLRATLQDGQLRLEGALTVWTLAQLPPEAPERLELSGLTRLDTAGAWYLAGRTAAGATLLGLAAPQAKLLESVTGALPRPDPPPAPEPGWRRALDATGRWIMGALVFLRELAEYLGRFLAALWRGIRHPRDFRLTALVHHCQETGLRAVPIVALMSFLIGVVLAFQGAAQLSQFGAEIFVIDLIAISILRELGILLTAIIVAGRTASALTASIGSMKMNEEIDAMRTLGLDPDMVLILPRVLALVITLPILGLIANLAGLIGGAIMSWVELGISPSMFRYRLIAETSVDHVIVGLSKAPVFAIIIGIIGCHAGMKVGKDAESLGAQTSTAVVNAIFAVIVADALFSVFFAEIGL